MSVVIPETSNNKKKMNMSKCCDFYLNIQNPVEYLRWKYLRFCENSQQFSVVIYFREKLNLRCSTGFGMRLCCSSCFC